MQSSHLFVSLVSHVLIPVYPFILTHVRTASIFSYSRCLAPSSAWSHFFWSLESPPVRMACCPAVLGFPFPFILWPSLLDLLSRIPCLLFLSLLPYFQGEHLSGGFRERVENFRHCVSEYVFIMFSCFLASFAW